MAQPIPLHIAPRNPREELRVRLETAPDEHAEAVLAAYDLLQELHEHGVLDTARSALAASDELIATVVDNANTPEAMNTIRNLLFWATVLGRIEPERLKGLVEAIPSGLAQAAAGSGEPERVWTLLRRLRSTDSRRGLAAAVDFLEGFGRHLHAADRA